MDDTAIAMPEPDDGDVRGFHDFTPIDEAINAKGLKALTEDESNRCPNCGSQNVKYYNYEFSQVPYLICLECGSIYCDGEYIGNFYDSYDKRESSTKGYEHKFEKYKNELREKGKKYHHGDIEKESSVSLERQTMPNAHLGWAAPEEDPAQAGADDFDTPTEPNVLEQVAEVLNNHNDEDSELWRHLWEGSRALSSGNVEDGIAHLQILIEIFQGLLNKVEQAQQGGMEVRSKIANLDDSSGWEISDFVPSKLFGGGSNPTNPEKVELIDANDNDAIVAYDFQIMHRGTGEVTRYPETEIDPAETNVNVDDIYCEEPEKIEYFVDGELTATYARPYSDPMGAKLFNILNRTISQSDEIYEIMRERAIEDADDPYSGDW